MVGNEVRGRRVLRIAMGMTALVLLLAGGAGALSDMNISPHTYINNSIMHRLDAGIPYHPDFGMPFRNQTGELTSKGLNAGRIPENRSLPSVTSIEKAAGMISANAGWFINDSATGGDCTSIGTWNVASKTCTLTTDLTETIEIDSDGITLDGNGHTITGPGGGRGIYLSERNRVTVKNTNIRNFFEGIYLYNSSYNTLSGNNVSNNEFGIVLDSSSNNNILSGNNVSNNGSSIDLYYSSNNTLSGNNFNSNTYDGIRMDASSYNTLSGNNANSNKLYGIILTISSNNMLSGNNANSNNNYGILLQYSSNNNTIYDNFFNNTNNFGITYSGNTWNTAKSAGSNIIGGPYLGGNFWAYPNGTGFSQTCADSDSDGICDSP